MIPRTREILILKYVDYGRESMQVSDHYNIVSDVLLLINVSVWFIKNATIQGDSQSDGSVRQVVYNSSTLWLVLDFKKFKLKRLEVILLTCPPLPPTHIHTYNMQIHTPCEHNSIEKDRMHNTLGLGLGFMHIFSFQNKPT